MFLIGISVLNGKPVDECANRIRVALENNRVTTMGKLSANIEFYEDANGYIMVRENIDGSSKATKVGEQSVKVEYCVIEGGSEVAKELPLESAGTLMISFDRASGSLKPIAAGSDAGKLVTKFIVSRGENKLEVKIDKLTGRVDIN